MQWNVVTPSNHPKFLVKGTELHNVVCGRNSRFQICEMRCFNADGFADRYFLVRDAETVTDAQVKAGVRPAVVRRFDDLDQAEQFVYFFN